jgi:hypothetical protein
MCVNIGSDNFTHRHTHPHSYTHKERKEGKVCYVHYWSVSWEKSSQKCTKGLIRTCSDSLGVFVNFCWLRQDECFYLHKNGLRELESPTSIKEMRFHDSLIEVPYVGKKDLCLNSVQYNLTSKAKKAKRKNDAIFPCHHGQYSDIYKTTFLSGVEVLITLWVNFPFLILYWQLANVLDLCFISSFEKFYLNNLPFYCGFWVIDFFMFIMYTTYPSFADEVKDCVCTSHRLSDQPPVEVLPVWSGWK